VVFVEKSILTENCGGTRAVNSFSTTMESNRLRERMNMGMSGMDSGTDPMFRPFNQLLAFAYWKIIAGIVGFILVTRILDFYQVWSRSVPSTPGCANDERFQEAREARKGLTSSFNSGYG